MSEASNSLNSPNPPGHAFLHNRLTVDVLVKLSAANSLIVNRITF
nr:hypothetical protein [Bifidobacterium rousetti]